MAIRTPLKLNASNNLVEMSAAEITVIKNQARHLWSASPSVNLSYAASGGNLGSYTDTRKQAGASNTDVTNFDTAGETANISTVTVTHARVSQAMDNTTATADTSNIAFPVYQTSGNVQSMTITDMYDTFIYPVINDLVNGSDHGGTYRIANSTSLAGHTVVSASPIFWDTRANVGAYTAGGIGETQDQPTTVTNYYLHKANANSIVSYQLPMFITAANKDLQQYTATSFNAILLNCMRHVTSEVAGHRIRYSINGTGANCGTGMIDTILNGAGNYQTRFVNADDYRAQEFPNGSAVTANTYFLKIRKE